MAQLMPLPLTVSCFSKIQIGFNFWYRLTWLVLYKGPLNVFVVVFLHTHTFNGPLSGSRLTTRVSRYQKGKTNLVSRFMKYFAIYHDYLKFVVRSTYDSEDRQKEV